MISISNNKNFALCVLVLTAAVLLYYSLWVLGLPFVNEQYLPSVERLFPAIHLAFVIPMGLGCFVSLLLFSRAFYLVSQDRREEQERLKQN